MEIKPIKDSVMCMLKCSVAATALNPGSYLLGIFVIEAIMFNVMNYIVLGTPVYYLLRNKSWMSQTIAVWFAANIILFILVGSWINSPDSFITILLGPFIIASILSIFPIGYLCRKAKEEMEFDKEIERLLETND